jgi:hypothetical protein
MKTSIRVRPAALLLAAVVLCAGFSPGRGAAAATYFFQAAETAASTACPAPCYQIRMFYEDATRSELVDEISLDVDVVGDATVAQLPTPPVVSSTIGHGNTTVDSMPQPWNVYCVVGRSPDPAFDVRIVEQADPPLSVDLVAQIIAAGCAGSTCSAITAGLAADRIYLGRVSVTWHGGPVGVQARNNPGLGAPTVFDVEGLPSFLDPDGDGWDDPLDNCPSVFNPDQADLDRDRIGDVCNDALDADGDELRDTRDNCPSIANPAQENRDHDLTGDVCDFCPDYSTLDNVDFDGNGIGDPCECGDQTQDAVVNVLDLLGINMVVFGMVRQGALCDTNFDGRCSVADIVGANRKIFGHPAYCTRYPPPGSSP